MTYRIIIDPTVTIAASRYMDDPQGLHDVLAAIDALADDPRPPSSVPYGKTVNRLHHDRWRVMYEITELDHDEPAIMVFHLVRLP